MVSQPPGGLGRFEKPAQVDQRLQPNRRVMRSVRRQRPSRDRAEGRSEHITGRPVNGDIPVFPEGTRRRHSWKTSALAIQVVVSAGFAGGQRPSGVGYDANPRAEHSPLESPTPWTDKEEPRRPRKWSRRRWAFLIVAIAIVIGVVAAIGWRGFL